MIPNQFRRPSTDDLEIIERLLLDGRVDAAAKVMDYAVDVVSSERVQLRADRDTARQKLRAMDQIAAMKTIQEKFRRIGSALAIAFASLQKPTTRDDYAKAN